MDQLLNHLTIGTFAREANVSVETIRFYQRKNLLSEPDRCYGSIRRYGAKEVSRVRFIKSAQRMGFTLDEVAHLLQLEDGTHCSQARQIAEQKLADVRQRLVDLHRMETALDDLVRRCCPDRGQVICPLIAALQQAT